MISTACGTLTPGYVTVSSDGYITHVGKRLRKQDAKFKIKTAEILIPGLVDIHNHGFGGAENLEDHWTNPAYTLERLAKQGTTSVLASIMYPANKLDKVEKMTQDLVKNWIGRHDDNSAVIMGLHAEGPIIASLGGLPATKDSSSIQEWTLNYIKDCGSALKVMTIAPSCEAATNFQIIKELHKRNVTVSLGHDKECTES